MKRAALPGTMTRIAAILGDYGEAAKARNLPSIARGQISALRLSGSGYGSPPESGALVAGGEALKRLAEDMAAQAAVERDAILNALAGELESIRGDIIRQAAEYAIELGVIARNMRTTK